MTVPNELEVKVAFACRMSMNEPETLTPPWLCNEPCGVVELPFGSLALFCRRALQHPGDCSPDIEWWQRGDGD